MARSIRLPSSRAGPIAGVAGDQQAALFGQACFEPGVAKNTYGTGCFMLMNTGTQAVDSKNKLLTTVAWKLGGQLEYALEGAVFVGGAVVAWLRDGLGIIKSSAEVEALARSVPDSGGVYLVPAFAGLGAPHWDPVRPRRDRGHHARHDGRPHRPRRGRKHRPAGRRSGRRHAQRCGEVEAAATELRVDGGASVNDALLQYQADIMQLPVVRPK